MVINSPSRGANRTTRMSLIHDDDTARILFHHIEELRQRGLDHLDTLSMGMSGDLETAVAEGATIVRIGSALFGERPAKQAPPAGTL